MTETERAILIRAHIAAHETKQSRKRLSRDARALRNKRRGLAAFIASLPPIPAR